MSTLHLVDPELAPMVGMFPASDLSLSTLAEIRTASDERYAVLPPPPIEPVRYLAPGRDGAPDVLLLVFKPEDEKLRPAILHIHGGAPAVGL